MFRNLRRACRLPAPPARGARREADLQAAEAIPAHAGRNAAADADAAHANLAGAAPNAEAQRGGANTAGPLWRQAPGLKEATGLAEAFTGLVRERAEGRLDPWLKRGGQDLLTDATLRQEPGSRL